MAGVTLRSFRSGDERAFLELWNATYHRDPITLEQFVRQTLLDPNFLAQGCILAERGGRPLGFALAVAPGVQHLFGQPPRVGRLTGLGVQPEARGMGIAQRLLKAALAFLKKNNCDKVGVAAHEYYVAGLDKEAYADGISFLNSQGFVTSSYQAVAMGCSLYELKRPLQVVESEKRFKKDRITASFYKPEMAWAVVEFFRKEFPTWTEFFVKQLDQGNDPDDIVLAWHGEKVIGYCQRLAADHVGPFGVAEAYRGRGIGTVMLYRLLDRMRAKGYRFAWFGETGRAQNYYERAGFKLKRTYAILSKSI